MKIQESVNNHQVKIEKTDRTEKTQEDWFKVEHHSKGAQYYAKERLHLQAEKILYTAFILL